MCQRKLPLGPIPSQLGKFPASSLRWLYGNDFNGTIPTQLGRQTDLESDFYLHSNLLSGTIPTEIGLLQKFTSNLYWHVNRLSGSAPSEIGKLTALKERLHFYSNALTQTLPSQLGQLVRMRKQLTFSDNSISGDIPTQVGRMRNIRSDLWLFSNLLSSTLPTELAQLGKLQSFSVESNSLTGSVPSAYLNWTNLTSLALSSNPELCGDIPTGLGLTASLTYSSTGIGTDCCAPGNYQDKNKKCQTCAPGRYTDTYTATNCTACEGGAPAADRERRVR